MHSTCIRRASRSENYLNKFDGHVNPLHNQLLLNAFLLLLICVQTTVICLESNRPFSTAFVSNDKLELVEHGPLHLPASRNDQVYVNSFHVHLHDQHHANGDEIARRLAKRHGFTNLGKVSVIEKRTDFEIQTNSSSDEIPFGQQTITDFVLLKVFRCESLPPVGSGPDHQVSYESVCR